jgi:hypothetical protein
MGPVRARTEQCEQPFEANSYALTIPRHLKTASKFVRPEMGRILSSS